MQDLCELVTDGTHDSPRLQKEGVPFIKGKNISGGTVDFSTCDFISLADHEMACRRVKPQRGDILFSNIGSVGDTAVVKDDREFSIKNVALFRPDQRKVDQGYFYYLVLSPEFRSNVLNMRSGAAQPFISLANLRSFEVSYDEDPGVQRQIAGILSAYDELIENSQRRIQILEAMARALYREWFVEFRFPNYESVPLVASTLGEIPQGWEVKTLGQIAENFDRLRKPLSKMQRAEMQGQYPYYGAAKVFDYINAFIFEGEYLLMAEDGSVITTERTPVLQLVNEKFWPNNHTHVLIGRPPYSTHFLYLGLSEVDISPYITGAAQPKITQGNMNRIPFFCGPDRVHTEFQRHIAPMIGQSQILRRQLQNLRRTRDLLLPRLLSGQIALANAA